LISAPEVGPPHVLLREASLFQQQQPASAMYFIESGLVKLTRTSDNGRELILSVIASHQLAGEECLGGSQAVYQLNAECLTDVTVYRIPVHTLHRLFGIPEFAAAMMSYSVHRNLEFVKKVERLVRHDVRHRILHGLAELARLVKPSSDGTSFAIPMTQAEVASVVGATRETTSTTLTQLRNRNLVKLSRRLVTTVHPDMLVEAVKNGLARSAP